MSTDEQVFTDRRTRNNNAIINTSWNDSNPSGRNGWQVD